MQAASAASGDVHPASTDGNRTMTSRDIKHIVQTSLDAIVAFKSLPRRTTIFSCRDHTASVIALRDGLSTETDSRTMAYPSVNGHSPSVVFRVNAPKIPFEVKNSATINDAYIINGNTTVYHAQTIPKISLQKSSCPSDWRRTVSAAPLRRILIAILLKKIKVGDKSAPLKLSPQSIHSQTFTLFWSSLAQASESQV